MSNLSKGKKREKLDFKFVFHVSNVPYSIHTETWDKLYVSVESVETGKARAKTAKSKVQAGACRWPDAIIESTRLVYDPSSNSYDPKKYKFIVGMSPTRVLGEITLDLAKYVESTSATTTQFPLKSGGILHIKLQCLSKLSASSAEHEKNSEHGQASDDEADDASSVKSSLNLPPPTPNKPEKPLLRQHSDLSDASTPVTSNGKRPGRLSLPTSRSMEGRLQSVEADAKREAIAKIELEHEALKQQLSELTSQLGKKDEEISALIAERDKLREDEASFRQEESQLAIQLQAIGTELNEERRAAVEARTDFEAKLKDYEHVIEQLEGNVKQQSDAMELQAQVAMLESRLEEERKRAEDVSVKNMELQTLLLEQEQTSREVEHALMDKLQDKEEEVRIAEERCLGMQDTDPSELRKLRKEVEELEVDIKELTDENMELIFKCNEANKELSKYTGEANSLGVIGIEAKLEKFQEEHQRIGSLDSSNRELKAAKAELESKVKSLAEEMQALKNDLRASRSMHTTDRESFSARELRLKERANELHEKQSTAYETVAKLQAELEAVNKENSDNRRKKDELEVALNTAEMSKTEYSYRMADLDGEVLKSRSIAQKLEGELAEKSRELKLKVAQIKDMESRIANLQSSAGELEKGVQELQERDMQSTSRIVDLEVQLASSKRQIQTLDVKKQELESRVDNLEVEKYKLEYILRTGQEDNKFLKEKLEGTMGELAEANAQLELEVAARSASEKKVTEYESSKAALEKQVNHLEDENWHLKERIAGLEAQLQFLTDERDSSMQQNLDLNKEKSRLTAAAGEFEAKISELQLELSKLREQHEENCSRLEKQVEGLTLENKNIKEEDARELKTLEESHQSLKTKLADVELQLGERNAELEKLVLSKAEVEEKAERAEELARRAQSEKTVSVERLQLEVQKLSEQMDATCDEKERLAAQALIEASELRAQKLGWEDRRQELEETVQMYEADKSRLQQAVEAGKESESELKLKLKNTDERVANLETKASSAEKEFDAKLSKLEKEISELERSKSEVEEKAGVEHRRLEEEKTALEDKVREMNSLADQLRSEIQQLHESSASLREKVESLEKEHRAREVEHRCESIKLRRQNSELKQKMSEQEVDREELRKKLEQMEGDGRRRRDENGTKMSNGVTPLRSLSKGNVRFDVRNSEDVVLRDRVKALEHELKMKTAEAEDLRRAQQPTDILEEPSPNSLKELQRLQQVNQQLEEKLQRFKETSKLGNTLERINSLETELAEAMESNSMYKEQLRSAFAKPTNVQAAALQNFGDVDQVVSDLLGYKRKSSELEQELGEIKERYFSMSLRLAEVEGERAELVMTVRSLKNGRKP